MEIVEAILNGETEEEINNPECYLHYAESGENIPDYIETHEQRIEEARLQNLEIDVKYGAEELYERDKK